MKQKLDPISLTSLKIQMAIFQCFLLAVFMASQVFQWTECILSNRLDCFWTGRVYWHMGITLKLAFFYTAWHCGLPDILTEWVGNKCCKFKCLFGPGSIVFGDTSNICNLFVQFHKRIEHQSDTQCIIAKHPYSWKNTQLFFVLQ